MYRKTSERTNTGEMQAVYEDVDAIKYACIHNNSGLIVHAVQWRIQKGVSDSATPTLAMDAFLLIIILEHAQCSAIAIAI